MKVGNYARRELAKGNMVAFLVWRNGNPSLDWFIRVKPNGKQTRCEIVCGNPFRVVEYKDYESLEKVIQEIEHGIIEKRIDEIFREWENRVMKMIGSL
ncbi:MAG: hypothetical protein ACTSRG_25105 [Candidatus Helarchaeota archaeon]